MLDGCGGCGRGRRGDLRLLCEYVWVRRRTSPLGKESAKSSGTSKVGMCLYVNARGRIAGHDAHITDLARDGAGCGCFFVAA